MLAGRTCALLFALSGCLASFRTDSAATGELRGDIHIQDGVNFEVNTRDGTWSLDDVLITHGRDTRVTARRVRGTELPGNMDRLDFSDAVHIEFRGGVLDASAAQMMFRGPDLVSVEVRGDQAKFSHQPEGYARRVLGSADVIHFDAVGGIVRLSGSTQFEDGRYKLTSNAVIYNINDGTFRDDSDARTRGQAIIRLDNDAQRVPTPRTPDRSTAE